MGETTWKSRLAIVRMLRKISESLLAPTAFHVPSSGPYSGHEREQSMGRRTCCSRAHLLPYDHGITREKRSRRLLFQLV